MYHPCRSLVFLPIYIYINRTFCAGISSDYFLLSAASAYSAADPDQEEISGGGNHTAPAPSDYGNLVGNYDTGRQTVGGTSGILHTGGGEAGAFLPSVLLRTGRQIRMGRAAD